MPTQIVDTAIRSQLPVGIPGAIIVLLGGIIGGTFAAGVALMLELSRIRASK